jgi:hypothetical protein
VIRIRHLRVVGPARSYDASFLDAESGEVRSLSIIAGEISTGKSSILDFIDYCLGASDHPRQIEVQRQGRTALLELEIDGRVMTIERPLFNPEHAIRLHECQIAALGEPHATRRLPLGPPGNSKSLNWMLLAATSLEGIVLKQAPTQEVSATNYLSFRDVMDLAYLEEPRLNAGQLLHEQKFMKQLKLQQLIEVVFDVHDQESATLGERLKVMAEERQLQRREIEALQLFLDEHETPSKVELVAKRLTVKRRRDELGARLRALEENMTAETGAAEEVRRIYAVRQTDTRRATSVLRDRETLLTRLLPLRGQYAEDERKLVFLAEATQVFDPLGVTTCPSCLQPLSDEPKVVDGKCTLCLQPLLPSGDQQIDVDAERRSIVARLRAIDRYIAEVETEASGARRQLERAQALEAEARAELDSDVGSRLAPFVADRDRLVRSIEAAKATIAEIDRQIGYREAVDRRTGELEALEARMEQLSAELRHLQAARPDKDLVLVELSTRFAELLKTFGFPKLDDPEPPYLDAKFHPHVRGVPYEKLRSTGATTLVAVAWELTMFEAAIERGRPHPGFLMLDSPQNGLKPSTRRKVDEEQGDRGESLDGVAGELEDETVALAIAEKVWIHIRSWAQRFPQTQLVIVDNLPPEFVNEHVVARYSGDPADPPYGFIDNETGE